VQQVGKLRATFFSIMRPVSANYARNFPHQCMVMQIVKYNKQCVFVCYLTVFPLLNWHAASSEVHAGVTESDTLSYCELFISTNNKTKMCSRYILKVNDIVVN